MTPAPPLRCSRLRTQNEACPCTPTLLGPPGTEPDTCGPTVAPPPTGTLPVTVPPTAPVWASGCTWTGAWGLVMDTGGLDVAGGGGLVLWMAGLTSPGLVAAGMGTPTSLILGGMTERMERGREEERERRERE